jgi:hypothetical protein
MIGLLDQAASLLDKHIVSHRNSSLAPSGESYVRFGSKADIARDQLNVRFTPKSGH